MSKIKRLASILLTLIMALSVGFTVIACGPTDDDNDDDPPPVQPVLQSILITTEPTKLAYAEGEKFDPAGMEVSARYADGTRETVTNYTFMPNGPLGLKDTVITVSWQGKTVQQDISVRMQGSYAAAIKNDFDVDGHKLLFQIEGESYTRAAQKAWDKNTKETTKTNYASGGGFLGGSGFDGNWLEYDIVNNSGSEITNAVVEIRLCAMNYLGENNWSNTKQEISRFFDISIWGIAVDIKNITLYPGENSLETAYSNWVRMIIKDVRLIPGENTLRITSKALVDDEGVELKSSQNPNWGVIWRTASIDVIYVWQPAATNAIETFAVHGLGRRTGLTVSGAAHAPVGLNYFLDIVTDEVLSSSDEVIVSYAVDPFLPKAYTAKGTTGYNGPTLKTSTYSVTRGTRPSTSVNNAGNNSGKLSEKIAVSEPNHVYRITIPASQINGDIYVASVTVGAYQTLPLEMFNKTSAGWKQIPGTTDNTFNGALAVSTSQQGDGIRQIKAGYELDAAAAGKNFHYSFMQFANTYNYTAFRFAARRTTEDKLADGEYYSLFLKNNYSLTFEVGNGKTAVSAVTSDHKTETSPFIGLAFEREYNRFDIVGEYAGDVLTIQIYVNFQKWEMSQTNAIEGVSYSNGNLVHATGYKGNILGLHYDNNAAIYRPAYYSSYIATGAAAFTQPDKTSKISFEAETKSDNVNYAASPFTAADKASGGAYLGGLGGGDNYLTFTVDITAENGATVTLDLVAAGNYKTDTLDMVNLNNHMTLLIDGKFVDLRYITLPHGSAESGNLNTNWQHIIINSVFLSKGTHTIKILPVYGFPYNTMTTAGGDWACPNIDVLNIYIPE